MLNPPTENPGPRYMTNFRVVCMMVGKARTSYIAYFIRLRCVGSSDNIIEFQHVYVALTCCALPNVNMPPFRHNASLYMSRDVIMADQIVRLPQPALCSPRGRLRDATRCRPDQTLKAFAAAGLL